MTRSDRPIVRQIVRQGDVLLVPITAPARKATRQPRPADGRLILARGEVTGHAHVVADPDSYVQVLTDGTRELVVDGLSRLVHEEHTAHELFGAYRVVTQREYTPAAVVNVAD